ncbi:MAG TPA: NAAT family transporter, partial [Bacteroidetes bacterium]|nr:NAAT family transporter [Bacteroidota bacterium]
MENIITNSITVFFGFFAIMNPIANTPIFLGLTAEDNAATRKAVALRSLIIAFLLVTFFCILGKLIFKLFGITLPAFRIAGGILVFIIGVQMLHGEQSKMHSPTEADNQNSMDSQLSVAVSPLAMPILAGPGTIATAMSFSSTGNILQVIITIVVFALLCLITYLFFLFGQKFVRFIGDSGIKVITRLMGLILAVIGTQMVLQGISGAQLF